MVHSDVADVATDGSVTVPESKLRAYQECVEALREMIPPAKLHRISLLESECWRGEDGRLDLSTLTLEDVEWYDEEFAHIGRAESALKFLEREER